MSSSNEPGQPGPGGAPGVGSASAEALDAPPWQRGGSRPAGPSATSAGPAPVPAPPPGVAPGVDARVARYITGTAAPDLSSQSAKPQRPDTPTASELPDLSGPLPVAPQQRDPGSDRPVDQGLKSQTSGARIQVAARSRGPVRASLQIRHIDPWSALKVSSLLSVALFFVWMIAVAFLYLVLGGMGVWSKLNSNVGDLLTSTSGSGGELVSSGTIFGGAALIGLVNIVLLTAMATVGAFVYNLSTDIVGGIEVTLADLD